MTTSRPPCRNRLRRALVGGALALTGLALPGFAGAGAADAAAIPAFGVPNAVAAVIPALPYGGVVPATVAFDGSGSFCLEICSVVAWNWSFGDGATATGGQVSHVYTTSGLFTVSLTVTASTGHTNTATTTVNAFGPTLGAISLTPSRGALPLAVAFDGRGSSTNWDRTIVSYAWSFGDGATATGRTVGHVYTTPGVFTVSLTVTDSAGGFQTVGDVVYSQDAMRPPTGLNATSTAKGVVKLTWTNRMVAVERLSIERCAGSRCTGFLPVTGVPGTFTSVLDGGLVSGTSYRYRIRVYDYLGGTGLSTIVTVKAR